VDSWADSLDVSSHLREVREEFLDSERLGIVGFFGRKVQSEL
jgi:hypothetical protein